MEKKGRAQVHLVRHDRTWLHILSEQCRAARDLEAAGATFIMGRRLAPLKTKSAAAIQVEIRLLQEVNISEVSDCRLRLIFTCNAAAQAGDAL